MTHPHLRLTETFSDQDDTQRDPMRFEDNLISSYLFDDDHESDDAIAATINSLLDLERAVDTLRLDAQWFDDSDDPRPAA